MKELYAVAVSSMIEILESYSQFLVFVSAVHVIVRLDEVAISIINSESLYESAVGKFHVDKQPADITMSKVKSLYVTSS